MTDRDMPSGDVERQDYSDLLARLDVRQERGDVPEAAAAIRALLAALSAMPDRQAGINEGLEMAAKVAEQRRAIYAKKWSEADPFGPDTLNRHEYMQHTMEAFDILLSELKAISALASGDSPSPPPVV